MASQQCQQEIFYQSKKNAMKLNYFLLTTCLMSITAIAIGQEKGYYSIGNNSEKLTIRAGDKRTDTFLCAEKGYYSIQSNRNKLSLSLEKPNTHKPVRVINKGYYSIGNNAARLNER